MKEKIGMEKLIELLNEYETPQSGIVFKSYDDYDGTFYGVDIDGETEIAWSDSYICGKRFGWIGWLVENDKIDREKVDKNRNKDMSFVEFGLARVDEIKNKVVLMLLSISNSPIEDLLLYLK